VKLLTFYCVTSTFSLASTPALAQVTTSQYNNLRTGATFNEKILTTQNVNSKQFGNLGAFKVDGAVYAQPLFIPSVEIPGKGTPDVLFVATEHDSVDPGATPSISANGNKNAIVWAVTTKSWNGPDNKPAVLYAFDATKLGNPIYTSEQNSQRDRAALATRFVIPVVVNGRVYFGTRSEVEVHGLLK